MVHCLPSPTGRSKTGRLAALGSPGGRLPPSPGVRATALAFSRPSGLPPSGGQAHVGQKALRAAPGGNRRGGPSSPTTSCRGSQWNRDGSPLTKRTVRGMASWEPPPPLSGGSPPLSPAGGRVCQLSRPMPGPCSFPVFKRKKLGSLRSTKTRHSAPHSMYRLFETLSRTRKVHRISRIFFQLSIFSPALGHKP